MAQLLQRAVPSRAASIPFRCTPARLPSAGPVPVPPEAPERILRDPVEKFQPRGSAPGDLPYPVLPPLPTLRAAKGNLYDQSLMPLF
ncbi:hypothetical protein FH063_003848 [Azospirillum argentinense]|uniref:Uncharacterized protein n=1 Tax=Azospirillum argentinense TaxID=2970906 RepID=A0A5B0KY74_9PROT|nr:hypothetical protein FH063_003848 [Azospirillum argentinense]